MGYRYVTPAYLRVSRDTRRRWYAVVIECREHRVTGPWEETETWKIMERYVLGKSLRRAIQATRVRMEFRPPPGVSYDYVRITGPWAPEGPGHSP